MSLSKAKEYDLRFHKAAAKPFHFDQTCSSAVQEFIKTYANTVGCSEESIFFPLLSCCAACMGIDSVLKLNAIWTEPPIIWTLVITPTTLHKINIADHLRKQVLAVQKELCAIKTEQNESVCKKFVIGKLNLKTLQDELLSTGGQALAVFDSTWALQQAADTAPNINIMQKLHEGSSWFSSTLAKTFLTKTHLNIAVLSSPHAVFESLSTAPDFHELYYNCLLTICAEEKPVKFSMLSATSESDKLQQLFREIIKLHSSHKIVYKLSEAAAERFGTLHDDISSRAKKMARKQLPVFKPSLSYLARLSLVLHVLENMVQEMTSTAPVFPIEYVCWNCEIRPETVTYAYQILGYVLEQKDDLNKSIAVKLPSDI